MEISSPTSEEELLQHEGSFIATQDRAGQDSPPPDPRADKSHGTYLVSWLSREGERGQRGDVRERFPPIYEYTLGRAPKRGRASRLGLLVSS